MSIQLNTKAEVFMAVASTIISCDKMGTLGEKDFLFNNIRKLPVFKEFDDISYKTLITDINDKVYGTVINEDCTMTDEGLNTLCESANQLLDNDEKTLLITMASDLSASDQIVESESTLIKTLKSRLDV